MNELHQIQAEINNLQVRLNSILPDSPCDGPGSNSLVWFSGQSVELSKLEYNLFSALWTHQELDGLKLQKVWGYMPSYSQRTQAVSRLNRKIELLGRPWLVRVSKGKIILEK